MCCRRNPIFSIFKVVCPFQAKMFACSRKKLKSPKKVPSGRKAANNPSGGFRGPKKVFGVRFDASMYERKKKSK
jgi:hypothetical protein